MYLKVPNVCFIYHFESIRDLSFNFAIREVEIKK